jgi:response regulator of citrate/malate metabolism
MKPISIYIVEDELLITASLKAQLQNFGYTILGSSTRGESCLEEIEQLSKEEREPEIILMDIHLRGEMDGIETAKNINEKYSCGIIFLTGQSSKEVYERSFKIKPFGYLLKPIDMEQTKMTIEIAAYQRNLELKNLEYQKNLEMLLNLKTKEKNEIQLMYQTILDHSFIGKMILSDNSIIYANMRSAAILEFNLENLLKMTPRTAYELFHEEDREKITSISRMFLTNIIKSQTVQFQARTNHVPSKFLEIQIDKVEYLGKPALSLSFFDINDFQGKHNPEHS